VDNTSFLKMILMNYTSLIIQLHLYLLQWFVSTVQWF